MAQSRKIFTAGAVGVAALALIAASTSVTGAYFSDSHDGSITATSGGVSVIIKDPSAMNMNFAGLLPGAFQTKDVTYTAAGSGAEDVWLVFPTLPTSATAFLNGQKGTTGEAPALGRYGHFAVASDAGNFTSFNLTTAAVPDATKDCTVDGFGHGGSDAEATSKTVFPPYCPVPNAIKIGSNLTNQEQVAHITFGLTSIVSNKLQQNSPWASVPFKIVATQVGILPTNANN